MNNRHIRRMGTAARIERQDGQECPSYFLFSTVLVIGLVTLVGSLPAAEGVVEGVVVNGTRDYEVAAGVDVVLRARMDDRLVVVAQTKTQYDGRFRFESLPLDNPGPYVPGANLADVHFPGPRIRLDAEQPNADVTLAVFDSTDEASPLVIEAHDIVVQCEPGLVKVRETMMIDNPSSLCYVGRPRHEGGGPITLQLGIPADFERVTFDKAGFGRQFRLINGNLVTGIPWPPGRRELSFSYVMASEKAHRVWRRAVDLPSRQVEVAVVGSDPGHVTSTLPVRTPGTGDRVVFETDDTGLLAGQVLEVQLDQLSVPMMANARWLALLLLLTLVSVVSFVSSRRRHGPRALSLPKFLALCAFWKRVGTRKRVETQSSQRAQRRAEEG